MKIEVGDLPASDLHELLGRSIVPLPISLVSTVGANGVNNCAPYSLVFPVCWKPPVVCISIGLRQGRKKNTWQNIDSRGDFVLNTMGEGHTKPMLQAAGVHPDGTDKIAKVGLTAAPSDKVKSPRVAEAQISLECKVVRQFNLGEGENFRGVFFGEVVLVHVKDSLWSGGKIDAAALGAVGRLGQGMYSRTREAFKP